MERRPSARGERQCAVNVFFGIPGSFSWLSSPIFASGQRQLQCLFAFIPNVNAHSTNTSALSIPSNQDKFVFPQTYFNQRTQIRRCSPSVYIQLRIFIHSQGRRQNKVDSGLRKRCVEYRQETRAKPFGKPGHDG
jgi:hypothetical protein